MMAGPESPLPATDDGTDEEDWESNWREPPYTEETVKPNAVITTNGNENIRPNNCGWGFI